MSFGQGQALGKWGQGGVGRAGLGQRQSVSFLGTILHKRGSWDQEQIH